MTGSIGCLFLLSPVSCCQDLPAFPIMDDLPSPTGDGSPDGSSEAFPSPHHGDRSPPSWNPPASPSLDWSIEAEIPSPKRLSFNPVIDDEAAKDVDSAALSNPPSDHEAAEDVGSAALDVPKFPAPEGEDESLALVLATEAEKPQHDSESEDSQETRVLGSHLVGDDASSEAAGDDTRLQKLREKTLARAKRIADGHPSHASICGLGI